jgi:hypothetical protein
MRTPQSTSSLVIVPSPRTGLMGALAAAGVVAAGAAAVPVGVAVAPVAVFAALICGSLGRAR